MGVEERVGELEEKLHSLFKEEKLEEAANVIFDNVDEVVKLTEQFFPSEKAQKELRVKFKTGWTGVYSYSTEEQGRRMRELQKSRYRWEEKLLEARHPRRVARLWKEAKPKLEKRYQREFESRKDLAIMNAIFDKRLDLLREAGRMQKALSKAQTYETNAKEKPGTGWEMVSDLWRNNNLYLRIKGAAHILIGLIKDVQDPLYMITKEKDEYADEDEDEEDTKGEWALLTSPYHHRADFKGIDDAWTRRDDRNYLSWKFEDDLIPIILDWKAGTLSFKRAIDIVHQNYAKEAGIGLGDDSIKGVVWEIKDLFKEIAYEVLKKHYDNKQEGDCCKFMEWYSKIALERWKATAVDYDLLFDFHRLESRDNEFVRFFYQIKEGKERIEDREEKVDIGRLPELLKKLVNEGWIKKEDMDPPLRSKYARPDEILIVKGGKALPYGNSRALVKLDMKQNPGIIETKADPMELLPAPEGRNLPVLANDLSELADVLEDLSQPYYVLFKGDHTLFIASEHKWPNGEMLLENVHRLALLKEGADPKYGAVIRIRGEQFFVKREKDHREEKKLWDAVFDANIDATPLRSYTAVIDITPEEFQEKYAKDFLAHVFLHRPHLNANEIMGELDTIDEILENHKISELALGVGWAGKTLFSTFELDGKLAFQLKYTRSGAFNTTNVLFVAKTVIEYLEEVGLSIHHELGIDEYGRNRVKYKLNEREFQEQHQQEVIDALKGNGLVKVLSFALTDETYKVNGFGMCYEPCEHCKQNYIEGTIYRPDMDEQYFQGVNGYDLHALANHPETYVNEFDSFRKIHRLLSDVKDHIPVFISNPEILPELFAFVKIFDKYIAADAKSFDFWMNTSGGISSYEEEEIEDDPGLQKLVEKERSLHEHERELNAKSMEAVMILQAKYEAITGKKPEKPMKDWEISNFWSQQAMIYTIYQITAQNLLPRFAGQKIDEELVKWTTSNH